MGQSTTIRRYPAGVQPLPRWARWSGERGYRYQIILGDESLSFGERRAKLQAVDARIRQAVGALDAAVPLSLVAAYARELQSGVGIAGRPDVEARLNAILTRHGKSLASVLTSIEEVRTAPPSFPGRPGVSDTFGYIAHFLPIAAIAAVVELVFPLVLFAYTFWSLAWGKHKEDPPAASDGAEQRRALDRPRRSPNPDVADPDSYFRGTSAWRAPDDYRLRDH